MSDWPSRTAEYNAWMRRQQAYGRWQPYVDAEPARQHVLALREAGMGPVTIARLSGVPHGALAKLVYGDRTRGLAPSKRIRPETEAKILAVEATLDTLAAGAMVSALGTQRRIKALAAIGWPVSEINQRIGNDRRYPILARKKVTARTARRVRDLYDELSMAPGPSNRTRILATQKGWPPPLAYDDIDNPRERGKGVAA